MNNVEKAVDKLLEIEGFISNVSYDPGGLTFEGISKVYHPEWEGWKYVEEGNYQKASELVLDFYKNEYWDKLKCQQINSFLVAFNLFQIAVNRRRTVAVKDIQTSCLMLNQQITVDGIIGPKTIRTINKVSDKKLLEIFLGLQAKFYSTVAIKQKTKRKFINGWLRKRVYERIIEVYES